MISHNYHQEQQQDKTDCIQSIGNFGFNWRTFYRLYQKKEQSAAIERWKWNQIDDCQID